MTDHWQRAKRVMLLIERPLRPEPGHRVDATSALLSAVVHAQHTDQASEIERLCRHALRVLPDPFIPAMLLASRLLNAPSGVDEAEALLSSCGDPQDPERRAYVASLLSVASAWRLHAAASERYAADAAEALEDVTDDAFIGMVESRLAHAAQLRGDVTTVNELTGTAAARLERAHAYDWAASTVIYQYLPNLELGDLDAVRDVLARATALADLGAAAWVKRMVMNVRLGFAVLTGDEAEVHAAERTRSAYLAYDAFLITTYFAMLAGWDGRWHDFLAQLARAEPASRGQHALKDALTAVAATAIRDDTEARVRWRRAVHRLAHGPTWNVSDTRIRRLARALACSAGEVIGDIARAERAARPLRGTRQLAVYTGEHEPSSAGYQRLVRAMRDSRKASDPAVVLTAAQAALLKALASDASIPEIARQDPEKRSVATIRSHVQHLYSALDVHSRTAAVLKAKELLLL